MFHEIDGGGGLLPPDETRGGPRFEVLHRTVFEYAAPVDASVNLLHLEPRTFPFQRTISALLRVLPATRLRRFQDLFDNVTHHFEIARMHERLEVESRVRVHNLPLVLSDVSREAGLEEIDHPEARELTWAYLQESRFVSRHPEIWRQAIDLTAAHHAIFDKAWAIMGWVFDEFGYEPGSTKVNTHLEEAFALRRGVCQDFTHVMLGLCRAVDIPARYASGYLYNGPLDKLKGSQASHAWAEVYLPTLGWVGFDPTNNTLADERYIKIAVGRDYDDVAPIRGTYRGTAHCRMTVTVEVSKV